MDGGEVELLAAALASHHPPAFETACLTDIRLDDVDTPAASSTSTGLPTKQHDNKNADKQQQEEAGGETPLKPTRSTPAAKLAPSQLVITALACVAFLLLGGLGGIIGPSVPALAMELGLKETKLAGIFTCRGLGFLTGSFTMPFLDKYLQKHLLMTLCTFIAGIVTFAVVFVHALPPLLALMFFQGLSLAGVVVTGNAVMVEVWGKAVDPYMQVRNRKRSSPSLPPSLPSLFSALSYMRRCARLRLSFHRPTQTHPHPPSSLPPSFSSLPPSHTGLTRCLWGGRRAWASNGWRGGI